jgi:hypothetical protein
MASDDRAAGARVHERRVRRIARLLEKRTSPRALMALLVLLTGLAGFLVSSVLLHAGVRAMWLRYFLGVVSAYALFLGLLRFWLSRQKPGRLGPVTRPERGGGGFSDILDTGFDPTDLLDGEGCAILIVVFLVLVTAGAVAWIVFSAPSLLAELILDAAVSAGLYHRLRKGKGRGSLRTAIRRTLFPALLVLFFFTLIGFVLQESAPGASTLGEVWKQLHPR